MTAKTVPKSIFIGNEGAYLVPQIVNEMRFLWTPSAQFELGIDGTIEIVDPKTSQGTGNIIKVQIKTTSNPWAEETDHSFASLENLAGGGAYAALATGDSSTSCPSSWSLRTW